MTFKATITYRIDTLRLVLRCPEVSDAPAYVAILSNPLDVRHDPLNDSPGEITVEKYKELLTKDSDGARKGETAFMTICPKNDDETTGPIIGMVGYPRWGSWGIRGRRRGGLIGRLFWGE